MDPWITVLATAVSGFIGIAIGGLIQLRLAKHTERERRTAARADRLRKFYPTLLRAARAALYLMEQNWGVVRRFKNETEADAQARFHKVYADALEGVEDARVRLMVEDPAASEAAAAFDEVIKALDQFLDSRNYNAVSPGSSKTDVIVAKLQKAVESLEAKIAAHMQDLDRG